MYCRDIKSDSVQDLWTRGRSTARLKRTSSEAILLSLAWHRSLHQKWNHKEQNKTKKCVDDCSVSFWALGHLMNREQMLRFAPLYYLPFIFVTAAAVS